MIRVDITSDPLRPIVIGVEEGVEALTPAAAADLMAELGAALSLTVTETVKEPAAAGVTWFRSATSDYAAALSDGRTLRVKKEGRGWVGTVDGADVLGVRLPRKQEVQERLVKHLLTA